MRANEYVCVVHVRMTYMISMHVYLRTCVNALDTNNACVQAYEEARSMRGGFIFRMSRAYIEER